MTQAPPVPQESRRERPSLLRGVAIVLAALFVFWPSLRGEFVYDDLLIIQQNPQITSFAHLPKLLGSSYWDFLDPEAAKSVGYYRPLSMVLLTAGYVFGGGAPIAFHALNLLVYSLACLAGWRLATRLTGNEAVGFAAGLLFALHPLHVESVAWISALHDPLFALFGFLSLNEFLRWRSSLSTALPWRAGLLFLLALFCKDAAVALLPVALMLDLVLEQPENRQGASVWSRSRRSLAPFLAAFLGYYALRVAVFGDVFAGFDRTTTDFGVGLGRLALLRIELLGGAAKLLAWPADLNLFRPFQPHLALDSASFTTGAVGTALLLGAILFAALRRARLALALLLFLPAAIAPVLLRVESLGTFPLSDRFLFVPVLGFTTLFAWFALTRMPKGLGYGAIALVALAYGVRTNARLADWQNEEAMFRTAVAQNPRNPNVYWGLGRILLSSYKRSGDIAELTESRESFDRSMDLLEEAQTLGAASDIYATRDDHLQTNLGLGWCLLYEAELDPFHDYETARVVFERVIEYAPESERGWIGKGIAWLGDGEPNQAGEALRRAIELNDRSPEAHFNMGLLLMRLEEWDQAAVEFRRCTQLRNEHLEDLVFLARALLEAGQDTEATATARTALESFPDEPDFLIILGINAARAGRHPEAISWFDQALELRETHGAAHLQRGKSLVALGQASAAAQAFQRACELMPKNFEASYNFMVLLLGSEQPEQATPWFMNAYRLRPQGELDLRMSKAAEELHRDRPDFLVVLATIDADRGNAVLAEKWARKALELDPDHAPSQYILGVLLKDREEFVEAYDLLHAAADSLTDSYQAQMEFGEVLLQTQQELAAKPYLLRALQLLPSQTDMGAELQAKTREALETALAKIEELQQQQGPVPPPEEQ